jgi:hypothetical protein
LLLDLQARELPPSSGASRLSRELCVSSPLASEICLVFIGPRQGSWERTNAQHAPFDSSGLCARDKYVSGDLYIPPAATVIDLLRRMPA